ncbi:MAG: hypothetical protein LBG52_09150 [Candidatus Peribacteria bacterium]|nr:hypothetical protein [Candidatus Peribacteria bacterium]
MKRYIPELYDSLVTSCITLRGRNPHQDLLYSELVDPCFHNPYGINWDEDRYEGYYRVTQKGKKCFYVYPMETLLKTDAGAICLKNFTGKISYMIDYEPVDLKTIEFTSGTVYITCEEEGIRCCITTDGVKIRQCIRVYLNNK